MNIGGNSMVSRFFLLMVVASTVLPHGRGLAAEPGSAWTSRPDAAQSLVAEARRYYLGDGVNRDYDRAFQLFKTAAHAGNADGQNGLGACYLSGKGTPKNPAEAVKYFKLAAGQGSSKACLNLAEMYGAGDGVNRDATTALAFALLAAGLGEDGAYARAKEIAADMPGSNQRDAVDIAEKTRADKGWKIVVPEPPGARGHLKQSGTGFFITGDVVLTCAHVINGGGAIRVLVQGKPGKAEILATDPRTDSALLLVTVKGEPLALGDSKVVKVGQEVFTVGFPNADVQGITPKYTKGEISALAGAEDDPHYFQVSVPAQSGNSGGPLVDASGRVIGVIGKQLDAATMMAAGRSAPQNVNYVLKADELAPLIAAVPGSAKKLVAPDSDTMGRTTAIRRAEAAVVLILVYEK